MTEPICLITGAGDGTGAATARRFTEGGYRVALLAPNVPELLEAHFAVLRVGAVLVAINTRLNASEVGYILDHSGARIVIADVELAQKFGFPSRRQRRLHDVVGRFRIFRGSPAGESRRGNQGENDTRKNRYPHVLSSYF